MNPEDYLLGETINLVVFPQETWTSGQFVITNHTEKSDVYVNGYNGRFVIGVTDDSTRAAMQDTGKYLKLKAAAEMLLHAVDSGYIRPTTEDGVGKPILENLRKVLEGPNEN